MELQKWDLICIATSIDVYFTTTLIARHLLELSLLLSNDTRRRGYFGGSIHWTIPVDICTFAIEDILNLLTLSTQSV